MNPDTSGAMIGAMTDSTRPPKPDRQPIRPKEEELDNGPNLEGAGGPGRIEVVIRRADRFQQDHGVLGFPFAVIQKFGNDQAGSKAALVAYYGLFALFPLLLLFTTILGYTLHDNRKIAGGSRRQRSGKLSDHRSSAAVAHPCPHRKRVGRSHRKRTPLVWRSWSRAGDPERDERGLEYSLRPLALYLPALPASVGSPRLARSLRDWFDGTHRVRDPRLPWLDSDGTAGGRIPGIKFRPHLAGVQPVDGRRARIGARSSSALHWRPSSGKPCSSSEVGTWVASCSTPRTPMASSAS